VNNELKILQISQKLSLFFLRYIIDGQNFFMNQNKVFHVSYTLGDTAKNENINYCVFVKTSYYKNDKKDTFSFPLNLQNCLRYRNDNALLRFFKKKF